MILFTLFLSFQMSANYFSLRRKNVGAFSSNLEDSTKEVLLVLPEC